MTVKLVGLLVFLLPAFGLADTFEEKLEKFNSLWKQNPSLQEIRSAYRELTGNSFANEIGGFWTVHNSEKTDKIFLALLPGLESPDDEIRRGVLDAIRSERRPVVSPQVSAQISAKLEEMLQKPVSAAAAAQAIGMIGNDATVEKISLDKQQPDFVMRNLKTGLEDRPRKSHAPLVNPSVPLPPQSIPTKPNDTPVLPQKVFSEKKTLVCTTAFRTLWNHPFLTTGVIVTAAGATAGLVNYQKAEQNRAWAEKTMAAWEKKHTATDTYTPHEYQDVGGGWAQRILVRIVNHTGPTDLHPSKTVYYQDFEKIRAFLKFTDGLSKGNLKSDVAVLDVINSEVSEVEVGKVAAALAGAFRWYHHEWQKLKPTGNYSARGMVSNVLMKIREERREAQGKQSVEEVDQFMNFVLPP